MKKLIVTLVLALLLQGCSTVEQAGNLLGGIGNDISGLSKAVKNQIKNE